MMQSNKKAHTIGIEENQYKHLRTINSNKEVSTKNFSSTNEAILFGILGGVGIAMFLVAAQLMVGNPIALKFLKFIALFGVLRYGLDAQDTDRQNNYNLKNGIYFGVIATASIAVILALINIFMFGISPDLAFDTFSTQADSIGHFFASSRIFFFETLVFGITIIFIILQSIKTKL